jgi:hypothetical protein
MAEPQDEPVAKLAFGYNRIARDLDRAIRFARFSPLEHILLGEAREASWTCAALTRAPRPLPFKLNFSALARLIGCNRVSLSVQFAEMVRRRVFLSAGDHYLINKDYRTWLDTDGAPLLSPTLVASCLELQSRADTPISASDPISQVLNPSDCSVETTPCSPQTTPPVVHRLHPCSPQTTPPVVCTLHPEVVPPTPPVGERASERISEELRISNNNSRDATTDVPPPEDQDRGLPVDPKLVALVAWGEKALADAGADVFVVDDFGLKASNWLKQGYSVPEIKRFIGKAIGEGAITGLRFARYVQTCLATSRAESRPLPPAARPKPPEYHNPAPRRARSNGELEPDGGAR